RTAFEHRAIGISIARESSSALQDRAQPFAFPDAVSSRVNHFASHRNRRANVVPASHFADGEHIAVAQADVSVGLSDQGGRDENRAVLAYDLAAILHQVTSK